MCIDACFDGLKRLHRSGQNQGFVAGDFVQTWPLARDNLHDGALEFVEPTRGQKWPDTLSA
jgi:hypothetical protein